MCRRQKRTLPSACIPRVGLKATCTPIQSVGSRPEMDSPHEELLGIFPPWFGPGNQREVLNV